MGEPAKEPKMDKKPTTTVSKPPETRAKSASPRHLKIKSRYLITAALLIVVSVASGFGGGWFASHNKNVVLTGSTKSSQKIVTSESQLINNIAKTAGPSVVSIDVTSQSAPSTSFFGNRIPSATQQSAGTGFIISSDGIVITNRHVVPAGAQSVSVTLSDGTQLDKVSVIGRTSESDSLDVAFLKINDKEGKTLVAAALGDSSKMVVGDAVVAIGNALGQFQNTVTSGIISGYGRDVTAGDQSGGSSETLQDLFQTDAAINEGNSGGPLVNISGEVIGINTAIAGGAQNIGFAIPINDVRGLIKSVLTKGKLERPYLGVRYVTLTDDIAYQLNVSQKRGAYITPDQGEVSILAGSPAEKAGLKEKDIIVKVDDITIDDNNSLTSVLGRHSVGDTVTLTVVRDGKTITVKATLAAAPQQ